jgi:putative tryptophan/tyrosine transport system substrate-binding protein
MASYIRRRKFLAAFGGAAVWPLAARAQQPAMPKVGWLSSASPESSVAVPFFKQGLADLGYVEGRNVVIEYAWARSHPELFPSLAAGLVKANVTVIAAVSGAPAARAAMAATATIPIVLITPGDPVQQGLVNSLNRPGANVTGLTMMNTSLTAKQMEIMNEVLPAGAAIAILSDPNIENEELESTVRLAGQKLGRRIVIIPTASENDFDTAIAAVSKEGSVGLVVPDRPLFTIRHNQLAALIARDSIPAIFPPADLSASGGLMSYGASTFDMFRRAGVFVGKILQGAKPAEMPVEQPTRIMLKVNLKTAKALSLDVPPTLLARADEVIE